MPIWSDETNSNVFLSNNLKQIGEVDFDIENYSVTAKSRSALPEIVFSRQNPRFNQIGVALDMYQARDIANDQSVFQAVSLLHKKILSIPMDSRQDIQSILNSNPAAKVSFTQFLRQHQVLNQSFSDNMAESKVQISLLIKSKSEGLESPAFSLGTKSLLSLYLDQSEVLDKGQIPIFDVHTKPTRYSGLIIDMRGHQINPALLPKIYDESGLIIFDYSMTESQAIVQRGLVAYYRDVEAAQKSQRVGPNAYYVVALAVVGEKFRSDPVLLHHHSKRILAHSDSRKALAKGRIVFLID